MFTTLIYGIDEAEKNLQNLQKKFLYISKNTEILLQELFPERLPCQA